jgi:hypothetical protein
MGDYEVKRTYDNSSLVDQVIGVEIRGADVYDSDSGEYASGSGYSDDEAIENANSNLDDKLGK